ncbi:MAG TPA: hypothetical protein VK668_06580 [Mucilaginibacter sp.]|nr:hypothetical protein [Mucilaginibacter sp.]
MIPIVVTLWENPNFTGRKRLLVDDTENLPDENFNDVTSSITIQPGPDYLAWKSVNGGREPSAAFFKYAGYLEPAITLTVGIYANIQTAYNFGDVISSVKFNPLPIPGTITSIPVVVELFDDTEFKGKRIVIVEDSSNFSADFGPDFDNCVGSVIVTQGPNWTEGSKAQLFQDINWNGRYLELPVGRYPNIGQSNLFNNITSSIKTKPPYISQLSFNPPNS